MPPKKKRYLGPTGARLLKIAHLLFAMMWTGCGIAVLLVLFVSQPENADEHHLRSQALKVIDDFGIVPGALGCMFTGILYGLKTPWGFFRQKWMIVKWIVFMILAVAGLIALNTWINQNALLMHDDRFVAEQSPSFHGNTLLLMVFCPLQLSGLIFMTFISVFKPWKGRKRNWVPPLPEGTPVMSVEDNV
ncbi:MAG TPA: hypothetical protein DEB39_10235 [Planctomycetaceae bacterium]|nr:hypothetical protein [Planctomycetaceae bacterium]